MYPADWKKDERRRKKKKERRKKKEEKERILNVIRALKRVGKMKLGEDERGEGEGGSVTSNFTTVGHIATPSMFVDGRME